MWGWEPKQVLTHDHDDEGRKVTVLETEPEWDPEQIELITALEAYESTLDEHGFPLAESTSVDSDPDNPDRIREYRAKPKRVWSTYALELEQKKPEWSGENYLRSRVWEVEEVTVTRD